MTKSSLPVRLFAALYILYISFVVSSASHLPARVATHFDAGGQPDGWMSRSALVLSSAVFGLLFPLLVVGICWAVRFFPGSINIPQRAFWLSPARRRETFDYVFNQSWWFACLAILFILGIHGLLVEANSAPSAHLSTALVVTVAGAFLAGVAVWVGRLISHFRRVA